MEYTGRILKGKLVSDRGQTILLVMALEAISREQTRWLAQGILDVDNLVLTANSVNGQLYRLEVSELRVDVAGERHCG